MRRLIFILLIIPVSLFGQYYPMANKIFFWYTETKDSNTYTPTQIIHVTDSAVYMVDGDKRVCIFECKFRLPVGDEVLHFTDSTQTIKVKIDSIGYKYTVKRKEVWIFFWHTLEEDLSMPNNNK